MHQRIFLSLLLCLLLLSSCETHQNGGHGEEAAIRKSSESYAKAFNNQDPNALASLWAEDAEYVNPRTGEVLKGRKEIADDYRSYFEEPGNANLEIEISDISFPEKNRAIESGTATVTHSEEEPRRIAFKAFYEKRNGKWLLTQVREAAFDFPPTNYEKLKELEWLVGRWVDEDEDSKIETICEWDKYKNFLTQHFIVTVEGQRELEGRQVIGWDAANDQIRSWVFDSDGGFGEGTWHQEGDQWIVETSFTFPDGRQGSAINIYTPVNKEHYTWESTGREAGGEMLPNIEPVNVQRVAK